MKEELSKVCELIDSLLKGDDFPDTIEPASLKDAVKSYPLRGGKRLRPAIALWSCGLFGGDLNQASYAAAAVEVFHNWTLVHDDIIDDDDQRRGKPTTHVTLQEYSKNTFNLDNKPVTDQKFGQDFALLAGDLQQGWANALMLKTSSTGVSPEVVLNLITRLQTYVNRELISGEALDVEFGYRDHTSITVDEIERMLYLKTGVLLRFCAEAGAAIALNCADMNDERIQKVGEFAATAGIAFQYRDDWLGVFGDEKTFGKPVCSDVAEAKPTILLKTALRNLSQGGQEQLQSYVGKKDLSEDDIQATRTLIQESGAEEEIQRRTAELITHARTLIQSFDNNKYRALLESLLEYLVTRNV